MLKDFARRLFFRRSTAYFLISFLCACAQIVLRTALFLTDNDGARRKGVTVFRTPLNATPSLYSLMSDGGFEICLDVPGSCNTFTLDQIRGQTDLQGPYLCPMLAAYSADTFRNNRLEDVIFISIHIYLVFVTVYTVARESIPHIILIFAVRCLSAAWAFGRVIETFLRQGSLIKLVHAAQCGSEFEFFGQSFFIHRHTYEVLLLGVSVLSVMIEAFVANKLSRIYSERPWRVVQVSAKLRKMYRLILGFSVGVKMAGLILPAAMGLWADQLINTYFAIIVRDHKNTYRTFLLFVTFLLPLWIALGWFALRREWKRVTLVFLGLGITCLCCWIAILTSAMFLWTFTTWVFFGTLYIASLALLIAAVVLAVLCRRNFGNNLDHYLMVQSRLSAMDFAHAHFEKDEKLDEGQVPKELELELDNKHGYERDYWGDDLEKNFESE